MSNIVNFDIRWVGEHGIGRFAKEVSDRNPDFKKIQSKLKPSSPLDPLYITYYLFRNEGLYFTPGYNPPIFFLNRCIITIHDLNHIDIDSNTSFFKRIYYRIILKRAARLSRKVFTVSNFSKERICNWAKIPRDKVVVVGNGVSPEFGPNAISPHEEKYILIVGNRKAHKNEVRAIESFYNANLPKEIKLFITGVSSEELYQKIKELNIQDRVNFLGRVNNTDLAGLYKGAELLLFPSLYEGFGLPVIEAMACGTPVITSNITSLPEIAANAAILVNPRNIEEITQAIKTIMNDEALRKQLVDTGYKQAKKYTWNNTVRCIQHELKKILNEDINRRM